jgi:hypothetical protein
MRLTTLLLCVVSGLLASCAPALAGSEQTLPDGRQWELVSPQTKDGSTIESIAFAGGEIQAAENGDAITYLTSGPFAEPNPEGNLAPGRPQILSNRIAPGVWGSQDIVTPHKNTGVVPLGNGFEYKAFSSDLSAALIEPLGETLLVPPSSRLPQEQTIYMRDDSTGAYQALINENNVKSGAKLGEMFGTTSRIHYDAASPDLKHVVFSSTEDLSTEPFQPAGGSGRLNLYEWSGSAGELGTVRLVSVLPQSQPHGDNGPTVAGGRNNVTRNAVSLDGSRVVWEEGESGRSGGGLFVRDLAKGETVRIDKTPEEVGVELGISFEGANPEDTKIFFVDRRALVKGADEVGRNIGQGIGIGDLYVAELSGKAGALKVTALRDLTLDSREAQGGGHESGSIHGDVIGYGGEATSGGGEPYTVYFADHGVLSSGRGATGVGAVSGANNLYLEHFNGAGWEAPRFIVSLSDEDAPSWGERPGQAGGGASATLVNLTARVSESGRYLAFMSSEPLTGYDNRDAASGVKDEEVFVYDSVSGRLACASCDPSGDRPKGLFDPLAEYEGTLLVDEPGVWRGHWLAGSVPGWMPTLDQSTSRYQSRYLSDAGRLFFDSTDDLTPGAVNGVEDVYEWEPVGVGGCSAGVGGQGVVFEAATGGCVGLVSGGSSSEESVFLDASGAGLGGEDVFFLTVSQLVPGDIDSARDIYDAHECSSVVPCSSGSVSVAPACDDTASCRAAPAVQPGILGAPASATFVGQGNLVGGGQTAGPPAKVGVRRAVRAQKLAKALKACRANGARRRQAACEARAQRRYGRLQAAGRANGRTK